MVDEGTKFEEFKGLIEALSDVKAKLVKLEERKNTVREAVYEKVKADYEVKLNEVEQEIEKKGDYIEKAFNSSRSEIRDLVNQRNSIEEEVEELSLRHYLGEFEEEEHERLYQEKKDLLESLMGKLEDSTNRIEFLKTFLPESVLETLSEEAVEIPHEEVPVESVEASTEPVGEAATEAAEAPSEAAEAPTESLKASTEPVETLAGSLEVAETEEVVEEETPKEEVTEEQVVAEPAESPVEEMTAETPEKTVEQPTEMLSGEEADALIEEKISPVEEMADIMKQPELAPEAGEKDGVECPKCGMVNEPESWYCEKCGAELLAEGTG